MKPESLPCIYLFTNRFCRAEAVSFTQERNMRCTDFLLL